MSSINDLIKSILRFPILIFQWIGYGFLAVIEFFEKGWQPALRFFARSFDFLGNTDSGLSRFFRLLGWPFVAIAAAVSSFLPHFETNPILNGVKRVFVLVFYPLIALIAFLIALIRTRSRAILIWGIPLATLVGLSVFFLWRASTVQRGQIARSYRQAIETAIAEGQYDRAQLYQQKLQQLGSSTQRLEMKTVEQLASEGRIDEAVQLAQTLAPLDVPGFEAAHFWLAQQYVDGKTSEPLAESIRRADIHMGHLRKLLKMSDEVSDSDPPVIIYMMAVIRAKQDRLAEAVSMLKPAAEKFWPAAVLQFEVNIKLKRMNDAIENSLQLSEWFKKDPAIAKELGETFFPVWVNMLLRSGKRDEWRRGVSIWFERVPQNPVAAQQWVAIQTEQIDTFAVRGATAELDRAAVLLVETASRLSFEQRDLLAGWLIGRIAIQNNDDRLLDIARRAELLETVPSNLLEMLGTAAAVRNEIDHAVRLFRLSIERDPNNTVAWNNLAYVTHQHFPDQHTEAWEFATRAFESDSKNIEVRKTRGMIALSLNRWRETIDDLQPVIAARPNSPDVHAALARAYQEIGELRLAKLHEQLAISGGQ